MQNTISNTSGILLLKSHVSKIVKDAESIATRMSSVAGREVALNKSTTAIYNLTVSGNLLDITVKQIRKA